MDEEGQKLLGRVLEMFTEQYTTLLGSLEKKHNFHLDQLLGVALCGPRRLKREVSREGGREREGEGVCVHMS